MPFCSIGKHKCRRGMLTMLKTTIAAVKYICVIKMYCKGIMIIFKAKMLLQGGY